jgi:hypothetical protein
MWETANYVVRKVLAAENYTRGNDWSNTFYNAAAFTRFDSSFSSSWRNAGYTAARRACNGPRSEKEIINLQVFAFERPINSEYCVKCLNPEIGLFSPYIYSQWNTVRRGRTACMAMPVKPTWMADITCARDRALRCVRQVQETPIFDPLQNQTIWNDQNKNLCTKLTIIPLLHWFINTAVTTVIQTHQITWLSRCSCTVIYAIQLISVCSKLVSHSKSLWL